MFFMFLIISKPVWADVLPVKLYDKTEYESHRLQCPSDKPLYSFISQKCYSCDDFSSFDLVDEVEQCEEICPNRNRLKTQTSGRVKCFLKDAPSSDYILTTDLNWEGRCPAHDVYGRFHTRFPSLPACGR